MAKPVTRACPCHICLSLAFVPRELRVPNGEVREVRVRPFLFYRLPGGRKLLRCRGQEGLAGAPGLQAGTAPPTGSLIGPPLGAACMLIPVILQN